MTDEKANAPSAAEPLSQLPPATKTSEIPPPASDSIATEPGHKSSAAPASTLWRRLYAIVTYTPQRCRHDPTQPPRFSMPLNLLFGFAGTFTVANLYYNHPILNKLAESFGVTNEQVSIVPTLMQAGYASGLLFLCPLGDIFRRRAFVLVLVWFTATVWIGLCITNSFAVFAALSFITALTTVTPQLMLPLVGDLAPPGRRATALSIVVSGLMLGMLLARVLSGVVTQYTHWRNIYWLSFALQYLILLLLWLFMPDYPSTNPAGLNYFKMLWSIPTIATRHPILVQAGLTSFFTSSIFTSFWTTLTFLLSSPPYSYPPLTIGLFALIGLFAMAFGPLYSRLIIDRFVPLFSVVLGLLICLAGVLVGTYTGAFSVAGPVVQAFAIDLGLQTSQIANRSNIYGIEPKARNRVNTAYMVAGFCGQLMGTAVGNHLYARGGWIRSGSASVGFIGAALCAESGSFVTDMYGIDGIGHRLYMFTLLANSPAEP
ncbi:major facilitator superfamily transporter [Lasallia pustulata]|uniref:Major facilitator superfamily transporter n=1 Tax=Lasallia pustulata TaxID=136370 RepID=A0A1W5DCZ3_9LECA|nr:major facilitator superfamily transporter [Lasallia pustulata]